jgi:tRNA (cytidine/uridine-2'-O-)-methyltransferase
MDVNVVLVEPEIPPNTGNVARLCAAARATLHLIEPLGFKLDDAQFKRAGLDYWQHPDWHRWPNWRAFQQQLPAGARVWLIESKGPRHYAEVRYQPGDYLVFGRETAGLPAEMTAPYPETWLRIPMFEARVRSLNLSNCVALVLYEALRQQGFAGEI